MNYCLGMFFFPSGWTITALRSKRSKTCRVRIQPCPGKSLCETLRSCGVTYAPAKVPPMRRNLLPTGKKTVENGHHLRTLYIASPTQKQGIELFPSWFGNELVIGFVRLVLSMKRNLHWSFQIFLHSLRRFRRTSFGLLKISTGVIGRRIKANRNASESFRSMQD